MQKTRVQKTSQKSNPPVQRKRLFVLPPVQCCMIKHRKTNQQELENISAKYFYRANKIKENGNIFWADLLTPDSQLLNCFGSFAGGNRRNGNVMKIQLKNGICQILLYESVCPGANSTGGMDKGALMSYSLGQFNGIANSFRLRNGNARTGC